MFCRWVWNSNIDNSQVNELTPQGYDDLNEIAVRFRLKYPEVFKDYDPEYYYVSSRQTISHIHLQNSIFAIFEN